MIFEAKNTCPVISRAGVILGIGFTNIHIISLNRPFI
jgi:hypothetical protein